MRPTLVLFGLCLGMSAFAQSFQQEGEAFVWRGNGYCVRFDKGQFSAGLDQGKQVSFTLFQWHDAYLYETLHGGKLEQPPTLNADGTVTMSGEFSAREGSAPLRYRLRLTPTAESVQVHCEFAKSAPLKLVNGVWLHLHADSRNFTGQERLWLDPAAHGTLSVFTSGSGERFLIELADSKSLCLSTDKFREANLESSTNGYRLRMNLLPGNFPEGEWVAADLRLGFAPMPDRFPGDILPATQKLALGQVTPSAATVPLYEKLELSVDAQATWDNPFDPADVALDATFTSPSGRKLAVPGFYMTPMRRELRDGNEVMVPIGDGVWRVRFTPTEAGTYRYALKLRDRTGEVSGGAGSFRCTASKRQGFIRVSKTDPHYLAFDNGDGFFAIGHNLPGYHTSKQTAEQAMRKLAGAGENYNRWWLYSYNLGLEWTGKLGWYRQEAGARLDAALDWGHELGLYYMLCMDTHQDFRESGWQRNPFNAKNGGPCANAGEWFTNEAARTYYKKRLRYLVARYGYSPSILCWEFGNEMEGWADSPDSLKLPWHREMSDTLRALDPFGHLITTSFWSHTGPPEYWQLPNLDIVQTHLYTNGEENVAEVVRRLSLKQWREFSKPHIFGEFGIDSRGGFEKRDPQAWGIHNALWAGLTSFCAGGPMPWWHENYIEPNNLYFHFTALRHFTADLPLGKAKWELLEPTVAFQDKTRPPDRRDAVVTPMSRWGKPEQTEFVLQEDGNFAEERRPQQLLQGLGHQDLQAPVIFEATYPQAGQFIMHVGRVSNSGLLTISLDGRKVRQIDLPCGEGLGKSSVYREQWKLWESTYDQDFPIDIPAGKHRIQIENSGQDWVSIDRYTFTGCLVRRTPNLLACGMQSKDLVVLWLQNRDSDWANHGRQAVPPIDATEITLPGLANGKWTVEYWETWKGTKQKTETIMVKGGKLTLRLPALKTDVALKLKRTP